MAKNRNLIILSAYLFVLISTGVIYTAYYSGDSYSSGIAGLRIDSIEPAMVTK